MWLKLDLAGIDFRFRIKGYTKSLQEDWSDQWCGVDLTLESGEWLRYSLSPDILLSCEVEKLRNILFSIMQEKQDLPKAITFIEPDLSFHIHPSGFTGYASMDLHVHLWNHGLTENYISISFDRDDLEKLYLYLQLITGLITRNQKRVQQLLEKGIFWEDS